MPRAPPQGKTRKTPTNEQVGGRLPPTCSRHELIPDLPSQPRDPTAKDKDMQTYHAEYPPLFKPLVRTQPPVYNRTRTRRDRKDDRRKLANQDHPARQTTRTDD